MIVKTRAEIYAEVVAANPEVLGDAVDEETGELIPLEGVELEAWYQAQTDELFAVEVIKQAILDDRSNLPADLRVRVEQMDIDDPVLREPGVGGAIKTLTLWDREDKLRNRSRAALDRVVSDHTARVQAVKDFAGELIVKHFPEWRQRNMIAWSADLTDRLVGGHVATPEELGQKAQVQGVWAWVQAVRAFSGAVEARVQGGEIIDDLSAEPWPSLG